VEHSREKNINDVLFFRKNFQRKTMRYGLVPRREKFAQLIAQGALPVEALVEAFDLRLDMDKGYLQTTANHLLANTDIKLRIQELQRPVIRKIRKNFEYNLNRALEDAEDAYNLAYEAGNPNTMLAAIELRAKLCKFLTETVEHKHSLLDDASTQTLIEMRKQIEKQKKSQIRLIDSSAVTVDALPQKESAA
jgi:hypothetical protein